MAKVDFGGNINGTSSGLKGVISGIDTEAVINKLVDSKKLPIKDAQQDIESYNQQIAAYSILQNKIQCSCRNRS